MLKATLNSETKCMGGRIVYVCVSFMLTNMSDHQSWVDEWEHVCVFISIHIIKHY